MPIDYLAERRGGVFARMKAARDQWPGSVMIGVFIAFAFGLTLLMQPIHTTVPQHSGWRAGGNLGFIALGLAFLALVVAAHRWPRGGGYATTCVVCVLGLATSIAGRRPDGVIIYGGILGVATWETWIREKVIAWIEALHEDEP